MSLHLFRPAEPESGPGSPVGTGRGEAAARTARQLVALLAGLSRSRQFRHGARIALLLLGLVLQGVLLLTVAYLIDLSVSLMELWAELAQKHLELTL